MRSLGPSLLFIPNLLIYLASYHLHWMTKTTGTLSLAVAIPMLLLGLFAYRKTKLTILFLWLGLFVILAALGAYLEYPSDPVEHLRRIYQWSYFPYLDHNGFWKKFAYFFNWIFIKDVPILSRPFAIDLVSAFWQTLPCIELALLCRALGMNATLCALQVVGFLIFFGTDLFSFRYYALSSTPLAYAAYLGSIRTSVEFPGLPRTGLLLILYLLLMKYNHPQCLGFLGVSIAAIIFVRFTSHKIILGVFALATLGLLNLFRSETNFINTLGIPGLLALAISFYYLCRKKHKLVSCLCLAPTFIFLFPPTAAFLNRLVPAPYYAYRVLFAFPTSVALILFLSEIARLRYAVAVVVMLALSLPPNFPWRGRLWFQLHRAPPERELSHLYVTADWLNQNRKLDPTCAIATDVATNFFLSTQLSRPLLEDRRDFPGKFRNVQTAEELFKAFAPRPVCAILAARLKAVPLASESWVTQHSKHWRSEEGNFKALINPQLINIGNSLRTAGWTQTEVPPFYVLFEPP